jgi:hypothetical protein
LFIVASGELGDERGGKEYGLGEVKRPPLPLALPPPLPNEEKLVSEGKRRGDLIAGDGGAYITLSWASSLGHVSALNR